MADRVAVPVVHTIHGAFVPRRRFYRRHGHKALLVAISRTQARSAPAGVRIGDVVSNPIAVDRWPLRTQKQDYLLWIGRMDSVKGAHRAIEAARLAGRTLVLAGPVQPGQEQYFRERVEPHIDGRRVQYVGEVAGVAKQELYANAAALLMPIRWREPFGMVMVEALACGTPVIAFPEGAAAEIVIDGENGMLVDDEAEMARARSPASTRSTRAAAGRASPSATTSALTAAGYERVYRRAIAANRAARTDAGSSQALPPHGSALTTAVEHWKREAGRNETEFAVSRTGRGRASRVKIGRTSPRVRDDGA